jgi:hypothetical protein
MTSPYKLFETNKDFEKSGITLDYGDFWIKIARAGGANKKYEKVLQAKLRPFQAQLRTNTLDNAVAERLYREIYASAVILGWGSKEFGEGKLVGKDNDPLEFNIDNAIALLSDLPDLFNDIKEQSEKVALFRNEELREDAKNS